MKDLLIESTTNTPKIDFKQSGELTMEGRSLPEDTKKFYLPVLEWVDTFASKQVVFNIKLEYINTSSSKQVLDVMKKIVDRHSVEKAIVNWYYEEGDLDGLETGEHFATILKEVPFEFIEYAETDEI